MSAGLYFAIQRLRGGLRPDHIDRASELLNRGRDEIDHYIERRLEREYGATPPFRAWLADQPIMSRRDLQGPVGEVEGRVEWRRTSGSTGEPVRFPKSMEMIAQMDAAMWAVYRWHGIEPGHRQARFWGAPQDPWKRRLQKVRDRLLNRRRLSAFEITPERSREFLRALERFRPTHAYGYPTLMTHFADDCEQQGLSGAAVGLEVVISTGEILAPRQRLRLESFWGCPVVNEYGCTESGILGFGCEAGSMHVIPWAVLLEVTEEKALRSDGPPGAPLGRGLVTDLYGSVRPLLRYGVGDRLKEDEAGCPCGRELRILDVAVGRSRGYIVLPSGRRIYDAVLAYTVPQGIQRFLVVQRSAELLEAYVIPGLDFDADTPGAAVSAWRGALGGEIDIDLHVVDQIPYSDRGKLRYFIPLDSEDPVGAPEQP